MAIVCSKTEETSSYGESVQLYFRPLARGGKPKNGTKPREETGRQETVNVSHKWGSSSVRIFNGLNSPRAQWRVSARVPPDIHQTHCPSMLRETCGQLIQASVTRLLQSDI